MEDLINAQLNSIARDMYDFVDRNPNWRTQDSIIISRSGCTVDSEKFTHTDNCSCDDEYQESLDD